jgi:hypothetical protein
VRLLKEEQLQALWEIVALGQYDGLTRPSLRERKAAKAAYRVLDEQGALPNKDQLDADLLELLERQERDHA